MTIEEVVAGFGDLTTLAPVAVEILRIADDENASMTDLVSAIDHDPALAARLLRMANSAFYSPGAEVTSLLRAATLLGLTTVKMLALGFNLTANLEAEQVDSALLWRHSLATSVVGRYLAEVRFPRACDQIFVAGLLGNVGKFALASVPAYAERFTEVGIRLGPDEERAVLGFTSDEVSAAILEGWQLPSPISGAVRYRPNPGDAPDELADAAAALDVAGDAACFLLTEHAEQMAALAQLELSAARRLGITEREIEDILSRATVDLNDLAILFDLGEIAAAPIVDLMATAQSLMAKVSLEMAAALGGQQVRANELAEANEKLHVEVTTDALTGLPNRRMYDSFIDYQATSHYRRPRTTGLALMLIDADHFKSVNDTHGHAVGDEVLTEIGARLAKTTRRTELTARIGGEEFALVMPDAAPEDLSGAMDRVRRLIAEEPIETSAGPLKVTVSIGSAMFDPNDGPDVSNLYNAADRALYASKANGRNRGTVASDL